MAYPLSLTISPLLYHSKTFSFCNSTSKVITWIIYRNNLINGEENMFFLCAFVHKVPESLFAKSSGASYLSNWSNPLSKDC